MSDEAKRAKAAATAAKAEAKALRPFYKKKRYWVLAIVVVAGIATATSSGSTTTTNNASSNQSDTTVAEQTSDTISSGIGSKDASNDIVKIACGSPDALDFSYPEVTVKNNSSKSSNYMITVVYESLDGSTRYDDTLIIINSLQPGQTMTESGLPVSDIPAGAVCKVTEIQRTAA